ncbi:MAG: endonuclease V, partial [Candidatus Thermoplasmatota archaeon]
DADLPRKVLREDALPSAMGNRFQEALEGILRHIPEGSVATCGAIARALGDVRAARSVAAWILDHPDMPGAARVVRADVQPILRKLRAPAAARDAVVLDALPSVGLLEALRREQTRVAKRVSETDVVEEVHTVGAVDVAYEGDTAFAAAVRCDAESLHAEEIVVAELRVDFPYIPTYLAFREFPPIEAAVRRLQRRPDVLFIDGHGRLHPTLAGLACYAGVHLGMPTIGVAKHALVGRLRTSRRGRQGAVPIEFEGAVRGYSWTPPGSTRPVYVSVGHRIALETALDLVQRTTRRQYPEPLRIADRLSKEKKREKERKRGKGERGGRQ